MNVLCALGCRENSGSGGLHMLQVLKKYHREKNCNLPASDYFKAKKRSRCSIKILQEILRVTEEATSEEITVRD